MAQAARPAASAANPTVSRNRFMVLLVTVIMRPSSKGREPTCAAPLYFPLCCTLTFHAPSPFGTEFAIIQFTRPRSSLQTVMASRDLRAGQGGGTPAGSQDSLGKSQFVAFRSAIAFAMSWSLSPFEGAIMPSPSATSSDFASYAQRLSSSSLTAFDKGVARRFAIV